jgi:putative hydrolase of the HAD superfamily
MHIITNGFEQTQRMKLQNSGIASYFQHIITSENCGSLKPHKAIFDYALRAAQTTADTSLMIGDALAVDIYGAQLAGMDQIHFVPQNLPDHLQTADTESIQPTYRIQCLSEMQQIL